ncbi:MAG: folylpolyglutamate synthase/dihydrofolate synthase family protein [Candidatus Bipolaricaulia bacterium]
MIKNSEEAFELLDSLPKYDVKPGLERIDYLLKELGNPDDNYPTIHVAGSNGKGSVAAMLFGILHRNHRVGEFLSPPLRGFTDRITVDGKPITQASIVEGIEELTGPIRDLQRENNEPSFFEATTALAAWYFNRREIDLALLEAGLGGRYDATNPVGKPVLSVITSVELEHQNILGNSLEEIAWELAGIAKQGKPLILGPLENSSDGAFRKECNEKGCRLMSSEENTEIKLRDFNWNSSQFEIVKSPIKDLEGEILRLGLAGTYQEKNLRTVLTVLGELAETEFGVKPDEIKAGLEDASWPGRFQLLERDPHLLVDGAHNQAAAKLLAGELRQYLQLRPQGAKIKLVFSGLKDKNLKGMLSALNPEVDEIYLTELDFPRAAPLSALERWSSQVGLNYRGIRLPEEAIKIAKEGANKEDIVCITGSLYLVREAIRSESGREAG